MRAVVQRCGPARVVVQGETVGAIPRGLTVFLGIHQADTLHEVEWLVRKVLALRILDDASGRFNLSVQETGGQVLVVPNFTVYGSARKGTRPSFSHAAPPAQAEELFEAFVKMIGHNGVAVAAGVFGTQMRVEVANDGPVTLVVDTPQSSDRP